MSSPFFSLNNIDKISPPSKEEFEKKYLSKHQPVIIKNLFDDQPIRNIKTLDDFSKNFSDTKVNLVTQYFSQIHKLSIIGTQSFSGKTTVQDLVRDIQAKQTPGVGASEAPITRNMIEFIQPPEYCDYLYDPEENKIISHWFLFQSGSYAHLHFDGDFRHVLFYQVVGKKRITLIKPEFGNRINPLLNHSSLCLENIDNKTKRPFLEFLGAYDCILEPGETLYMPPLVWHYLEYVESGLSFNFRFGRSPQGKFMRDNVFPDVHVQNIGDHMLKKGIDSDESKEIFNSIKTFINQPSLSDLERYYRNKEFFKSMCKDIRPGAVETNQWVNHKEIEQRHVLSRGT